jgi:hypothetical protein
MARARDLGTRSLIDEDSHYLPHRVSSTEIKDDIRFHREWESRAEPSKSGTAIA